METIISTTYTEAEFDAKLLSIINRAFKINGLAVEAVKQQKAQRKVLTLQEACDLTKLAKPTIYAMAPKGRIPNFKKGKRLYFYEDELLEWIQSGKRMTPAEIDAAADHALKTA